MDIFKKKKEVNIFDPNKTFVHPDVIKEREEAKKAEENRNNLIK